MPEDRFVDLPGLFAGYAAAATRRVIGIMSGTSADGVHAALVEVSGEGEGTAARLVGFLHEPYERALWERILALFALECAVDEVCRMNFVLGEVFAGAARRLADQHGGLGQVDLIASHGQTVRHLPRGRPAATLQIGEPAVIADLTGVTVVADFRVGDVAAGGQGAPLSAFADWVLLRDAQRGRAVQNLGGIGNVTFLPAGGGLAGVIAFDTGPGNMLIDAVVAELTEGELAYDRDGEMAARGRADEALLGWLMGHEFIRAAPPKTAGREEFGTPLARELLSRARARGLRPEEVAATATAFTAESVADAYRRFLAPRGRLDEVILGGGGAYNRTLREWISQRLPGAVVLTHEDLGIPGQAKEAMAFALLGNEAMLGRAAGMPRVTGAARPAFLGKIVPGRLSAGARRAGGAERGRE